ncbi:hypothetical protein [Nannocystis radixulma]|uniref:Uncharacterized protein n=1 Tax=Nannocystis radixulma TaxID=2995305 RepID=A0ABT5BPD7_9BACT|nr:hypothetical protein [Nannocystis radixulma]MDC0675558.1 hypothetical protein [Nannocystis radixulma]
MSAPTTGPTSTDTSTTSVPTTTSDDPTTGGPWELGACNPIDPALRILPYPSLFHMREAETATGWRVAFPTEALPVNSNMVEIDPVYLNEKDGFSTLGALLFYFADVDLAGTVGHQNLAEFADEGAKTVLLDVETGERVPHWIELDMTAPTPAQRLVVMHPATPLRHGKRYVVGVRGLQTTMGAPVAASPAFAALRDDVATDDGSVEGQRAHYELDVFPALAAAGFARADLQLAWDFVTVSRENSLGRMQWLRDDVLDAIGPSGPPYVIESVTDADCADADTTIGRTVVAEMTVPLYTVTDEPGTLLTRGPDGLPFRNGEKEVEVLIRIPCSLIDQPTATSGRVLQYGHGLLGGKGEAESGYLGRMANDNKWIIVASDWTGMKSEDTIGVVAVLTENPTDFPAIPERSMQGFTEFIAAMRLATGALVDEPTLQFTAGDNSTYSAIDPSRRSYYGNSQGGILGGAYLALSPDIERGVLGVGGMPYVLLLPRSADFDQFFALLKSYYPDHRDIMVLISLLQNLWDPGEAAGWAWAMNREPDPAVGAKQVLLQVAIGDAQVTTLGAHIQARAYGAATVAPQTRPVFGVEEKAPGFTGSALVEWRYTDIPDEPVTNVPPDKAFDPHECPRREAAAQQQLRDFLETGVVNQYCDGPCEGLRSVTCP